MDYKKLIKELNVYKQIKDLFLRDSLSQAYLFLSPDSVTNTLLLKNLSKMILCQSKNSCDICPNCAKVSANTHPDVLMYPKGENFVVEDASDIYDKINIKPVLSKYKIFIIENFDLSTQQAQNKMLKIIEEPPKNVIFFISATNDLKLLPTILSRVQKKYVDRIPTYVLNDFLRDLEIEIKNVALLFGDGYLGKTNNIANDKIFIENFNNMIDLLKNLKKSDQISFFSSYLNKDKKTLKDCLKILNELYTFLLFICIDKKELINNKYIEEILIKVSNEYNFKMITEILKIINDTNKKLEANVNIVSLCDNLLFDILEVKYLCK